MDGRFQGFLWCPNISPLLLLYDRLHSQFFLSWDPVVFVSLAYRVEI